MLVPVADGVISPEQGGEHRAGVVGVIDADGAELLVDDVELRLDAEQRAVQLGHRSTGVGEADAAHVRGVG